MRRRACWLLLSVLAAGCMEGDKPAKLPRRPSPYTDLVAEASLDQVVERFVTRAAVSPALREPLRNAIRERDTPQGKAELVRRLGAALGGPYPGTLEDLQRWFTGLAEGVTPADMAVLLDLLDKALDDLKVGPRARQEVMAALKPLRTLSAAAEA